jgi:hypothetical protein
MQSVSRRSAQPGRSERLDQRFAAGLRERVIAGLSGMITRQEQA